MSGGLFNYKDSELKNEIFDFSEIPTDVFEDREISELVWDVLDLIHEFDWYRSGDTGEEDYLKAKMKFKEKWLPIGGDRTKRTIDDAVNELRFELYKTFGLLEFSRDLNGNLVVALKKPLDQNILKPKMGRVKKERW